MKIPMTTYMQTQNISLVSVALVGALLVGMSGCGKTAKEKEPIVTVQTSPAEQAPISQLISAEAVVFPVQQAVITPKITAPIREFFVQRGSRVHQGQLLARLEDKDLAAAAEQSKGEFAQAKAGYATMVGAGLPEQMQKAELDTAASKEAFDAQQKLYDSRKQLFQQGALPRRDLDSAQVALAQARSQYQQAQKQLDDLKNLGEKQALNSAGGQLSAATGKYQGAEAQLSYSRILSPINGVVTDRPLYPGELATANQPLLTVMDISRLIAKTHIAQSEAAVLRVGNPAELRVAGMDEPVKGRVTLVSPALDPGSTTIEVWVEASKPDPALRPGMTINLSITAKTVKDAIVVPASAVFKTPEGADIVLLAGSDGHAHVKPVQIGVRALDRTQIVSGIKAGDAVITSGGYALPENTAIKIEAPAPAENAANKGDKEAKSGDSAKSAEKDKE